MRNHCDLILCCVALAFGARHAAAQGVGPPPTAPKQGDPSFKPPPKPPVKKVNLSIGPNGERKRATTWTLGELPSREGVVTRVTDTGIEVREKKGDEVAVVYYPAHDELAAGKVHFCTTDCNAYRLQDVKVNDVVQLAVVTEGDKTYVADISIRERPGGKIPESQKPGLKPYHLKRQAALDEQQKGIPVPENLRKWYHGMTPAEIRQHYDEKDKAEKAKAAVPNGGNTNSEKKVPDTIPKSK